MLSHTRNLQMCVTRLPSRSLVALTASLLYACYYQVYGFGKPRRDFTYVSDIVTGIVGAMALTSPSYEVFNLGNDKPVGLLEFIRTLESELGVTAHLNYTDMAPGDVSAAFLRRCPPVPSGSVSVHVFALLQLP